MDRNLLLAVVLSVIVVIGYQEYVRINYPDAAAPAQSESPEPAPPSPAATAERAALPQATSEGAPSPDLVASPGSEPALELEPDVTVETDHFVARLSTRGGRLLSLRLLDYRETVARNADPLEMITSGPDARWPLGVALRGERTWEDRGLVYTPSTSALRVSGGDVATLTLEGADDEGVRVRKILEFGGDRYRVDVTVEVDGAPDGTREVALGWVHHTGGLEGQRAQWESAQALVGKKLRSYDPDDLEGVRGLVVPQPGIDVGDVHWVGFADTYFLNALLPAKERTSRAWLTQSNSTLAIEVLEPLRPDGEYAFHFFSGPKRFEILEAAGNGLHRGLDLGFFGIVAEPMLHVIKAFHRYTGNFGVDIILLTVLIKILFIPLTRKSYQSMQDMQRIQPEMKRLQEKYKEDRQELNRQMMELYKRHKVNPLGGCLPMLLQMPVFIGLYNALFYAVELRHAPFMLWINDLSAPDRLPPVPMDPLAVIAGFDVRIPVLTILMGASMLVQQKMTPAMGDPAQQRMMMLMPVIFTVMFLSFPSGLVLYWFVNNMLTIAQQGWMIRKKAAA